MMTIGAGIRNRAMAHYVVAVFMLYRVWGKQHQAYLLDVHPSMEHSSVGSDKSTVSVISEY